MKNKLLTHTKHETTHFDVLGDKGQTAKVAFLPFAGKTNVKLNLSIILNCGFVVFSNANMPARACGIRFLCILVDDNRYKNVSFTI